MGLNRKHKFLLDAIEDARTKKRNRMRKTKECARRDERIMAEVKQGRLPYGPVVMSWLSRKLTKPSNKVTESDIQALLQ